MENEIFSEKNVDVLEDAESGNSVSTPYLVLLNRLTGWKKPFMLRISNRHCVTNFVSSF